MTCNSQKSPQQTRHSNPRCESALQGKRHWRTAVFAWQKFKPSDTPLISERGNHPSKLKTEHYNLTFFTSHLKVMRAVEGPRSILPNRHRS